MHISVIYIIEVNYVFNEVFLLVEQLHFHTCFLYVSYFFFSKLLYITAWNIHKLQERNGNECSGLVIHITVNIHTFQMF